MSTYDLNKYDQFIDKACPEKFMGKVHIHVYEEHLMWCTLNQTDLETNSNKYYVMQLLKHNIMNSFFLVSRSGRVGHENKKDFRCYLKEDKALEEFKKVFTEKTGYSWSDRFKMVKKDGKYDYVEMEVGKDIIPSDATPKVIENTMTQIDNRVEAFINLIFDLTMFQNTMKQFKVDTEKAPLGKISANQIKKAYGILTQIQELIKANVVVTDKKYVTLSSAFYTVIPTSHGNQKLPLLSTEERFKEKCDLLEILSDLEVAGNIMSTIVLNSSKVWQQYQSLKAKIEPLKDVKMEGLIHKYLEQTRGSTHTVGLKIRQIYEVFRDGEDKRFEHSKTFGNRQLLWHGSRLSNFVGILSQGLRIAPPEAPKTGYMFGKGVYFANSVTKSANYMYITNNVGVILLCEVALGTQYQKKQSEFIEQLADGYHSTWGMGQSIPDISETVILDDGLIIPMGKLVNSNRSGLSLAYDEFIVYNVDQIRIRYAIILDVK